MIGFIPSDRRQPLLTAPDLREWVPADDLVHVIIEAVERVDMSKFKVDHRGSGSGQYNPRMMVALLIFCYANGTFASRRIERATYRGVCVRFVTGNRHPDHETICAFRRENFAAIEETFPQILTIAKELKVSKVGTVSVDGTKIDADVNIHESVRYDRAIELRAQLKLEISALMKKAETSDVTGEREAASLPEEIAHREKLLRKIDTAVGAAKRRPRRGQSRNVPTMKK